MNIEAPDNALYVTISFQVKDGLMPEFMTMMKEISPGTRSFDGCQLFEVYEDQDQPGYVFNYLIWELKEKQLAYMNWREESGVFARIQEFVNGAPTMRYFNKIDG